MGNLAQDETCYITGGLSYEMMADLSLDKNSFTRAFQFAIRMETIRYANRFGWIRFVKNRPFDSLVNNNNNNNNKTTTTYIAP